MAEILRRMPIYRARTRRRTRQFFAFPPFSRPASPMTIKIEEGFCGNHGRKARVRVRVRTRIRVRVRVSGMIRRLRVRLGVLFVAFFKLLFIFLLIIFIYLFIFFAYRKIRKVLTWVQARGPGSSPARVLALVLARVLALVLARILAYGVTNRAYNWCHSYLSGRRQLVCIDRKESSLSCVNHEVPEGSILGPLSSSYLSRICHFTLQCRGGVQSTPPPSPTPCTMVGVWLCVYARGFSACLVHNI